MGFIDLEKKLRDLSNITAEVAKEVAIGVDSHLRDEFVSNSDWAPLKKSSIKRRGHNKPPLVDTEKLKNSLQVKPVVFRGSTDIRITLDWYMVFHQETRPLITDQDKITGIIGRAVTDAFVKASR